MRYLRQNPLNLRIVLRMITLDRLEISRNIQVDAAGGICLCLVSLALQLGLVDGLRWGL
jgi:hypothetical protein